MTDINNLRRQLREAGAKYMIVKNTLTGLAAKKVNKEGITVLLKGPTSIAFAHGDPQAAARSLANYLRSSKTPLTVKGGLLKNRVMTADEVQTFATLPPREVLLSRVAGTIQLPMSSLMGVLTGNMAALARVLGARVAQLEAQAQK